MITSWLQHGSFEVQSLFDDQQVSLQLFVHDTIAQARGSKRQRHIAFGAILLWWCVLGARVASHKGIIGSAVDWIGAHIVQEAKFVTITVQVELLEAVLISVKSVQSH